MMRLIDRYLRASIGRNAACSHAMFAFMLTLASLIGHAVSAQAAEIEIPQSTVGLPVVMRQLVLPGAEIEAIPLEDKMPIVIRIDAVYPHGTNHRYDLAVSGLEPGTFDLRDYLRRKDGASAGDLPELRFTVKSLLPAGQIEPHRPSFARIPWLGGYRLLIVAFTAAWLAGMAWLVWPKRRAPVSSVAHDERAPQSLAERLRPLVDGAISGDTSPAQLAELERALVAYWRRRMGLEDVPAAEVISRLRDNGDAAPLLLQLETWLHRPSDGNGHVDASAILAPYANLPSDSLEMAQVSR